MNLLISPLLGFSLCSFFSDEIKIEEKIPLKKSQCFADIFSENKNWEKTENIFFISGPASFTSLRNMSVFLETLQQFSKKKYNFYIIPTAEYLQICYPKTNIQLLSVGKRECFIFTKIQYKKYKNFELPLFLEKKEKIGGKEYISENTQKEISSEIEKSITDEKILSKIMKNKEKYYTQKIEIDYGAEVYIG